MNIQWLRCNIILEQSWTGRHAPFRSFLFGKASVFASFVVAHEWSWTNHLVTWGSDHDSLWVHVYLKITWSKISCLIITSIGHIGLLWSFSDIHGIPSISPMFRHPYYCQALVGQHGHPCGWPKKDYPLVFFYIVHWKIRMKITNFLDG